MVSKLKRPILGLRARRNAKQAVGLGLVAECAALLDQQKAQLQLQGLAPTWANFEKQPHYPEMMAGINEETKARLKKLWEGQ